MVDELVLANDRDVRLVIAHWEDFYEPTVLDGITWEIERRGTPSKLEFTIVMDDILEFCEGNSVRLYYKGVGIFYGYIFQKKRDKENHIKIVAYDQLRYFKNKDTYVYSNKTASELVKMLAKDFNLKYNVIEDTKYKISRIEENKTLFDMILTALDDTLREKKEMYVLYDDFGRLTLKNIASMKLDIVMDNDVIEDFDYNSSIDSDTYTKIKLVRDNEETSKRDVYIAQDSAHIRSWGILQLFETVDKNMSEAEIKQKCDILLKLYNRKTKTLSLKNVLGDIKVRAGCLLFITLNLGDIELQNYMLVEKVKHTFENNSHFMDLTLVDGDEFASYSSSSYSSGNTNNKDEKKNGPAQSTTSKEDTEMANKINKLLKGKLSGTGNIFVKYSNAYKVNPALMAAISMHESARGTSNIANTKNNFFGMRIDGKYLSFSSTDEGIKRGISNLSRNYIHTGRKTLESIRNKYSSSSDKEWVKCVSSFYKQITGNSYDNSSGIGVGSNEEAEKNLKNTTYQVQNNNNNANTSTNNNSKADKLINIAKSKQGCKYVWGAEGPNTFDCSGFTQWCYKQIGIKIPRTVATQSKAGKAVDLKDKSKWKAGDLLCRIGGGSSNHVVMYIGNNQIIHSPQTGDVVKIESVNSYRKGKAYTHVRRFI
ncbi:NlpC/P60 family protein [Clostridioides difficile]|uniref:C40 family peptidase n=6 Tax=Clostridioides difficile TaxID=1496 RepID=UPI00038CBE3E|nr:NlpC/P60 family protein [Clostridioides difficile]AXU54333.1 phage cell wall hydrolase [Clostridioides difficile]EQH05563.1 mannosyl-glycoendo-beta-N-acetylglucosaminidase family protein [Clostridioides difficile DA00196]EQJ92932.1 mannosyl-glycoendo-beta-N-acetylglucosaminidase family protein [Clostridioides difficile P50]MCP6805051.1 NlpC/P60 family protein [Clostridioides difficile]MDC9291479.1 NlpC/P60 family protein [Clostridioides difficile]